MNSRRGRWNFSIWKKESLDASAAQNPAWQRTATLWDIYGDFLDDKNFAFNPRFEMIAFLEIAQFTSNQASIWKFGTPHQRYVHMNISRQEILTQKQTNRQQ